MKQQMPDFGRSLTVQVIQSRLVLVDKKGQHLASWSPISGRYHCTTGMSAQHDLQLVAPVTASSQNPDDSTTSAAGTEVSANWSNVPTGGDRIDIQLSCQQQPLTVLEPLLGTAASELAGVHPASGTITGSLQRSQPERLQVEIDSQFVNPLSGSISQPPVDFDVSATYTGADQRLGISKLYAQVGETSVDLQGEINDLSGRQDVTLQGGVRSPSETFVQLLPIELQESIEFTGLQLSELSIVGPLRPQPDQPFLLTIELSTVASWQLATAYGLESKQGKSSDYDDGQRSQTGTDRLAGQPGIHSCVA